MVTTPLELILGVMESVTPELRLLTVFEKTLLPPDWTPLATPCEVSTGTSSPTFIDAIILSVAMMLGAEITRV